MSADLINRDKALIFRITHRANIPWLVANGIHCATSPTQDPAFRPIGNAELIGKRRHRALPPAYGGVLSDYVPFYFTPYSPMMYNIHTGYGGIEKQRNEDIVKLGGENSESSALEPDAHGQAALMLAESTLHALVDAGVFTTEDAVGIIAVAQEVKEEMGKADRESPENIAESVHILNRMATSFGADFK